MSAIAVEKKDAIFELSRNIIGLKYEQLPARAAAIARLDILDTIGVTLGATGLSPLGKKLADFALEIGGRPESTIIGTPGKVPAHMAAFVNAALAHALNFDDFYDPCGLHIGCMVLPPALAVAERRGGISGKELVTAYAVAVDLECRMVRALVDMENRKHDWLLYGWLTPQVMGYFGATAAAGRLLGLNEDQMISAFGLAYSQVGGGKQPLVGVGSDKGVYPGFPAQAGVFAALMAQKGIAGPRESLEGKAGLYNVYFQGEYNRDVLVKDLGKSFDGPGFYQFPCCGYTQYPIELALQLTGGRKLPASEVESVTIFAGGKSWALCEPPDIRRNPRMSSEAQYSLPFAVATAIAKGKPAVQHFTDSGIKDPEILAMTGKVICEVDPSCDIAPGSGMSTSRLEIKLKDGRTLRAGQSGLRYGHPAKPLEERLVLDKFRECASLGKPKLSKAKLEKLVKMVGNLEEVEDVGSLIALIS